MAVPNDNSNNNTFVSPRNLVDLGLSMLRQSLVLTNLVWKNPVADWTGRVNDTVDVRIDSIANHAARHFSLNGSQGWRDADNSNKLSQNIGPDGTQNNTDVYVNQYGKRPQIAVDTVHESTISMKIDDVVYHAVGVTDEQLTLDVQDFGRQVVAPQIRVMAEEMDAKVANLLASAPYQTGQSGLFANTKIVSPYGAPGYDGSGTPTHPGLENPQASGASTVDAYGVMADDFLRMVLQAKTTLDKKYVPAAGRTLVATPEVIFILLQSKRLTASSFGSDQIAEQALREGTVGTIYGFNIVQVNDPNLPAYSAFLFHQTAYILTTIAPAVPSQAPFGAVNSAAGFAMRWIKDYDSAHMIDRSVFTVYTGSTSVNDGGAYGVSADANKNVRAVYLDCSNWQYTS